MTKEKEKKPFRITEKDIEDDARETEGKGNDWGTVDLLFSEKELDGMKDGTLKIPRELLIKAVKEAESKAESGSKIRLQEEHDPDLISSSEALLQELASKGKGNSVNKNNAIDQLEGGDFYFSNGYEPKQMHESQNEILASASKGNLVSLRELTRRINNASLDEAQGIHADFLHYGYSTALLDSSLDIKSEVRDGKARVTASFELEKALVGTGKQIDLIRALKKAAANRARVDYDANNGLLKLRIVGESPEEHDLRGLLHPESEHLRTMRSLLEVADEHALRAVRERH